MTKELDEELVPGTVHLVDLEGILHVQKDANSKSNIILNPQPSSNPNDPLRWSQTKKNCQFAFLWIWAFMQAGKFKLYSNYLSFFIFIFFHLLFY